jgi:integrase
MELAAIEFADVDAYIAAKTGELSPKTISNHLGTLRVMFKVAIRWKLIGSNPVAGVDLPRVEQTEMQILSEAEIARLLTAYRELEHKAEGDERAWWRLTQRIVVVALATALRRGELLALRWRDVQLIEGLLTVRESLVRGQFQTPKSRSSRRTIELGPRARAALEEQWQESLYRADEQLVFGHPLLGSPLDPSKLSRDYMRPALKRAKIEKPFRVWHDLRHTALTHEAAAGNPQAYVQLKAGHSQGSITERYIHAAQVLFPGAAAKGEQRLFGPDPYEQIGEEVKR